MDIYIKLKVRKVYLFSSAQLVLSLLKAEIKKIKRINGFLYKRYQIKATNKRII
jgi:hypothetical protein